MLGSEAAIYGVVMVSGLLIIVANSSDEADAGFVLLKVVGTSVVFWLAHLYAGTVSHLDDQIAPDATSLGRLRQAVQGSLGHSWGMLLAPLVPTVAVGASMLGVISQGQAIWGTLWVNVGLLAVFGFWGVSQWSDRLSLRIIGGLTTAGFGLILVLLKVVIH